MSKLCVDSLRPGDVVEFRCKYVHDRTYKFKFEMMDGERPVGSDITDGNKKGALQATSSCDTIIRIVKSSL